jgi:hypothetical protein
MRIFVRIAVNAWYPNAIDVEANAGSMADKWFLNIFESISRG